MGIKTKRKINKVKRMSLEWEAAFDSPTSERGLTTRIGKELKRQRVKETNNPFKKKMSLGSEQKVLKRRY